MPQISGQFRRLEVDPDNTDIQIECLKEELRLGKFTSIVHLLSTHNTWMNCHPAVQDFVIKLIAQTLPDCDFKETKTWSCHNTGFWPDMRGAHTISCRLPTFVQRKTGIEFNLIPGKRNLVSPFLMARKTVTNEEYAKAYDIDCFDSCLNLPKLVNENDGLDFLEQIGCYAPTQNAWTHASLTTAETKFYFGDIVIDAHVWHSTNSVIDVATNHFQMPWPADAHDQSGHWNAYGLVDTIGGSWEYVTSEGLAYIGFDYVTPPGFMAASQNYLGYPVINNGAIRPARMIPFVSLLSSVRSRRQK